MRTMRTHYTLAIVALVGLNLLAAQAKSARRVDDEGESTVTSSTGMPKDGPPNGTTETPSSSPAIPTSPTPPPECVCDPAVNKLQLIRSGGYDENLKLCEDRYYCNCETSKKEQCWVWLTYLHEKDQRCGFGDHCAQDLISTTPSPASETTPASPGSSTVPSGSSTSTKIPTKPTTTSPSPSPSPSTSPSPNPSPSPSTRPSPTSPSTSPSPSTNPSSSTSPSTNPNPNTSPSTNPSSSTSSSRSTQSPPTKAPPNGSTLTRATLGLVTISMTVLMLL